MTRINAGISVKTLSDSHLMAEYREIVRVVALANKSLQYSRHGELYIPKLPQKFTMGTGHVKFFYNKLLYINNRYNRLCTELRERKFDINPVVGLLDGSNPFLHNDWVPGPEVAAITRERILSNAGKSNQQIRFHRTNIDIEDYKLLISKPDLPLHERIIKIKLKYLNQKLITPKGRTDNKGKESKAKAGKPKASSNTTRAKA